ncbi:MAG: VWA domain-containing protein [Planctomycetaceae bacterium]|nr:VWA domain-containing protein [Planctomycetaceae bacterium]
MKLDSVGEGSIAPSDAEPAEQFDTEKYDRIEDNDFLAVMQHPLSTFAIDVDTASYANVRRFLNAGQLPPTDAVRIEELVNYFPYRYEPPTAEEPFSVHTELTDCPWAAGHWLLRIGLKGKVIERDQRPPSNLVFLIDVSGSMQSPDKLPLLQQALILLAEQLTSADRVAIVVYAGNSGLVLPSTPGDQHGRIIGAIQQLRAGGSTNGGAGIELAYRIATESFIPDGTNRVILATDGDFNVGVTSTGELTRLIETQSASGVYLSTLGFGTGNYGDATLEQLADCGNGNYAYIDGIDEAQKVLVEQLSGTLVTIAKDVKIQIEFNPAKVAEYRLIGYENRLLRADEFNDDRRDAGEIGAGHTVTALYELVPSGGERQAMYVDPLKYQAPSKEWTTIASEDFCTLKLRYKGPDWVTSRLLEHELRNPPQSFDAASMDHRFAAAVAAFGMLLRHSPHAGQADWTDIAAMARKAGGDDPIGRRSEFVQLVHQAASLDLARERSGGTELANSGGRD